MDTATHPFHMHQAIHDQPQAVADTVDRVGADAGGLADRIGAGARVFLIGIGTSYHAARVGAYLLGGAGVDARAVHAFDFALYGPEVSAADCVIGISHRGTKRYTNQAMDRARQADAATALISGADGAPQGSADHIIRTVAQEQSSAHTVSYTTAVAALATLAVDAAEQRSVSAVCSSAYLRDDLPAAMTVGLGTESHVQTLARGHASHRRIWLAGAGPSAVTAEEIALKIKETSYLQAEGLSVETLLHGPFCAVEPEDLFVLIAPSGAGRDRTAELGHLIGELGAACIVVGDESAEAIGPTRADRIVVPHVPETLSPLTCVVPLQLFAYHLARVRGTNPDSFRADDPGFVKVQQIVQL
jgi:glucosamine--fructose-6-phosphate aminotransferase (isomerizing)